MWRAVPPSTSSRLPAASTSRASTTRAVPAASGAAAAAANEIAGLTGAAKPAPATTSSASPPAPSGKCVIATTRVTGRQAADPAAHTVDDPGDVTAKDARHDQPGPAAVRPVTGIDRINPSRVHRDPHPARAGHRISSPAKPQLLRPAELADQHRPHQQGPFRCR